MDTSDPMYCGEERLLTMENAEKYFKLKDDLRKLVEELKDVQDIYPGLHNVIAKIEKLIGGK